jgi:hypothetical protein
MQYEIRHIPAARAATVLALAVGLPYGILLMVVSFFLVAAPSQGNQTLALIAGALVGCFVVMLSIWVPVAVFCWDYNLVAGKVGGIALELREIGGHQQ